METIAFIAAWYAVGLLAIPLHMWWTTRELDYRVNDLVFCMFMAFLGPINLAVMIFIALGAKVFDCFCCFNGRKILINRRGE